MRGTMTKAALLGAAFAAASAGAAPAQTAADFYKGKTVQFMVGYGPSGGFDAYTRAAARFMGKHIPGNPNVIVQKSKIDLLEDRVVTGMLVESGRDVTVGAVKGRT